jgi:hypothetical protein
MSDIDAEKLEEALDSYDGRENRSPRAKMVLAAARAHLATLPQYLNVEVVTWCLVDSTGRNCTTYDDEGMARCACPDEWQVVKLTGTAKVRV